MAKPGPRATIYQFFDAMTAHHMLNYNLDFAAYLPFRGAEAGKEIIRLR